MMRLIRKILGAIILFLHAAFKPRPETRAPELQQKYDAQTKTLSLYHFEACPFCVRVRRHITRRNLHIELRDVKREKAFELELTGQGGQLQVPCLRIQKDDGKIEWLYESADIITYLNQRFS